MVDEEPIIRESVNAALAAVGYRVRGAASEREAMDLLREPVDALLLDQGLPGAACDEIVRTARQHSETPAILMSSEKSNRSENKRLRLGADGIIYKPLDPLELRAITARCLMNRPRSPEAPASPRILITDDDEIVLRSLSDILKGRYEISVTKSPIEALLILKQGPFEILLADLMMEEMDGMDLIHAAVNIRPRILPIVITAYATKNNAVAGFKEGVYDFLEKPFTPGIVRQSIDRAWKTLRVELENHKLLSDLRHLNEDLRAEIKERRQTETALAMAKETAEASNRAKAEFLRNMSHELRTPMSGVIGMIQLVLSMKLPSEQRRLLGEAQKSARTLLDIISDILDFSDIETGQTQLEPALFDLRDMLDETLKVPAMKAHEKRLKLSCHVQDEVPDILLGDAARLRQIILHLIDNAIRFTEMGVVIIHIEAERNPTSGTVILHFVIRDTGIGIHPEKQPLIFEAFTQADSSLSRVHTGAGLGLTISARLVDLMGGKIWAESTPGEGSAFHFTLPFQSGMGT